MSDCLKKSMNYDGDNPTHEILYNTYLKQCSWVDSFRARVMDLSEEYSKDVENIPLLKRLVSVLKSYKHALMIDLFDGDLEESLKKMEGVDLEKFIREHLLLGGFTHLDYSVKVGVGDLKEDVYLDNVINLDIPLEYVHSWEDGNILHSDKYMEHSIVSYNYAIYSLKLNTLLYETMDGVDSANTNNKYRLSYTYNLGLWIHPSMIYEDIYTDTNKENDWIREGLLGKKYAFEGLKDHYTIQHYQREPKNSARIKYRDPNTGMDDYRLYILKDPESYLPLGDNLNNILELSIQTSHVIDEIINVQKGVLFDIESRRIQKSSRDVEFLNAMMENQLNECVNIFNEGGDLNDDSALLDKILTFAKKSLAYRLSESHLLTLKHLNEVFKRSVYLDLMKYAGLLERNQALSVHAPLNPEALQSFSKYCPSIFKPIIDAKDNPNSEPVVGKKRYYFQWGCLCSHTKYLLNETIETSKQSTKSEAQLLKLVNDKKNKLTARLSEKVESLNLTKNNELGEGAFSTFMGNVFSDGMGVDLLSKLRFKSTDKVEATFNILKNRRGDFKGIPSSLMSIYCDCNVIYTKMYWALHLMFYYAFFNYGNGKTWNCPTAISIYRDTIEKTLADLNRSKKIKQLREKGQVQIMHLSDLLKETYKICTFYNNTICRENIKTSTELEKNPQSLTAMTDVIKSINHLIPIRTFKEAFNLSTCDYIDNNNYTWLVNSLLMVLIDLDTLKKCLETNRLANSIQKHITDTGVKNTNVSEVGKGLQTNKQQPMVDITPSAPTSYYPMVREESGLNLESNPIRYTDLYNTTWISGKEYVEIINEINKKIRTLFLFLNDSNKVLPLKNQKGVFVDKNQLNIGRQETNEDCLKLLSLHLMLNGGLKDLIREVVKEEKNQDSNAILNGVLNLFNSQEMTQDGEIKFNEGIQSVIGNLTLTHKKECIEHILNTCHNTLS